MNPLKASATSAARECDRTNAFFRGAWSKPTLWSAFANLSLFNGDARIFGDVFHNLMVLSSTNSTSVNSLSVLSSKTSANRFFCECVSR